MQTGTQPEALSRGRTNLALATLFLGMFVLGSGELLVVGLLTVIAADLQVSIPTAGVLVTAYIPVAWATSFLKPPATADATEPAVAAHVAPEPA